MSKLTKRLQKIAELVTKRNICDVGCDHGKLSDYLLDNGMVDRVIVSDISAPSLQKAIDLLKKHNYKFESICCDGLEGYSGRQVDQCIISGMGGDEIIKIISSSPIEIDSFILSPQHNNISVKKFMTSHGYDIDYDIIISDKGKFYNIFRCNKSERSKELTELQLIIGDANYIDKTSSADDFVQNEIRKIKTILDNENVDNTLMKHYLEVLEQYQKRN